MTVEIDQSWRFERTNRPTVVGLSNGKTYAIVIPARVKKAAFRYVEAKHGRQTMNVIRLFAASVLILLKSSRVGNQHFLIDTEYVGHEKDVKDLLSELAPKENIVLDLDRLRFGRVGKKSGAHKVAIETFRKKRNPNKIVQLEELVRLLA